MKKRVLFLSACLVAGFTCLAFPLPVKAQTELPAKDVPLDEMLSLRQSLELAGGNMLSMLNRDENYLPYFRTTIRLDSYQSNMSFWWPAHNIGRWWDAVFRLEESIGFKIPEAIEEAMLQNTKRFFNNPDYISLNPEKEPYGLDATGKKLQWDIHSLREGMLSLYALARWRNNHWAVDMGKKMINSVDKKLLDNGAWDMQQFDACRKRGTSVIHNTDPCDTHGRLLEALIWFYEQTHDESAKRLADRIAVWHFNNTTLPGGAINPISRADHTHSYLGTLRGLLLYGRLTGQPEYVARVADAYRTNVPRIVKPSGYTSHNMAVESFGETTSPGDVAQLAIWLYEEGYSEFLDDAERLVRARILPSQIRTSPSLPPASCAKGDLHVDLEERIIGAYGGCTVFPNAGKVSVLDVSAADVHSLVDIYQHIVIAKKEATEVLFHLNYEDERIKVTAKDDERQRTLTVTCNTATALSIRIPRWTTLNSIRYYSGDEEVYPEIVNHFAHFRLADAGQPITVRYELPQKITTEVDLGVEYKVYWRGDCIVGLSPNQEFFPFYPPAPIAW